MHRNRRSAVSSQLAAWRRPADVDDDVAYDSIDVVDTMNVAMASNVDDVALVPEYGYDDDEASATQYVYDCDHDPYDDGDLVYCKRCLTGCCVMPMHYLQDPIHLQVKICYFFVVIQDRHTLCSDLIIIKDKNK